MARYFKVTARSFVTILLCSFAAHAQAPTDTAPAALLRRAYELRLAGHDEAALPVLEQAFALSPTPNISAQLGLCDEAVGRWEAAEQHLHAALVVPNDPWVARHLQSLEGAYALALAHFPRESSAVPMGAVPSTAPASGTVSGTVDAVPASGSPSPAQTLSTGGTIQVHGETTAAHAPAVSIHAPQATVSLRLGYTGVVTGGVFIVGGFAAWIAREAIVGSFNGRGCRVGDPAPAADCDSASAEHGRDTATALAAAGLVVGGLMELAGLALVVMHGREWPQSRLTIGAGPGDVGGSVMVRF